MKSALNITIKDIAEMMSEAQEMGVAINMQIIPIKKDKEADHQTEKGGV